MEEYLPLCASLSTRDRQEGGTFVVSVVEGFTVVFIRKIFTVWLSITEKGLADAAP